MNNEIIIDALRRARIYIRSVEAWRGTIDDPPLEIPPLEIPPLEIPPLEIRVGRSTIPETVSLAFAFISMLNEWTEGGEVEAIDTALAELGLIV